MANSPEDVLDGAGSDLDPLTFLLKPLNRLFGLGGKYKGPRGTDLASTIQARINAGATSGTGVFSSTSKPTPPINSAPTPGQPTEVPSVKTPPPFSPDLEGYSAPQGGGGKAAKKKRKKGIAERIKDQLYREAMYYAKNPVELLRVLPTGRTMRGPGRARMSGRNPPSYQRGAVAAEGLKPRTAVRPRRARLDPRAGRIGTERPRASPKPLEPVRPPTARPAAPRRAAARTRAPTPQEVIKDLPFTDYDAEGEINAPARPKPAAQPARRAEPATAPGGRPGRGTVLPGPYGIPGTGSAAARLPQRLLANLPSAIVEAGLRAVTRQSPRVRQTVGAITRAVPLPIGDFPAALPTPAAPPASIIGLAEGLKPFPVPKEALDKCRCDQRQKKKQKPRQPRTVCRAGSYVQTAKGVKYHPNREVPCT